MIAYPPAGTQIPSSTGGIITFTKTGRIHTAGKNFSGRMAEVEARQKYQEKKSKNS